jgi:mRNA-degrading endonuclease toxin of MazEF toxin-antitoxin module
MSPVASAAPPAPSQGEIWVVKLPSEPADKGPRYVVVVSTDAQNQHPRATTVLVVPLSTTLSKNPCLQLAPGETGLQEISEIWANGITTVPKASLIPPRYKLRKLSHRTICRIAFCVIRAMGVFPEEIA